MNRIAQPGWDAEAWTPAPRTRLTILWAILGLALALRAAGVFPDYPFSYHGDELHFIKRAMSLGAGDLNPHWFHKPALLMYLLLFCYGSYFAIGSLIGLFGSVDQFGAHFLTNMGPFIVIGRSLIVAFGVGTVYVVYRTAMRAFGSFLHGAVAALVAAVLYPMAVGSQAVKADVPAGFFVALSFYWFLKSRESERFRPAGAASLLSGFAMGTKYYGIILLPGYLLYELIDRFGKRRRWRPVLLRACAVGLLFLIGFFAVSPYNFLDSTWGQGVFGGLMTRVGLQEARPVFDPDTETVYTPGLGSSIRAAGHLFARALDRHALGIGLSVLALLGLLGTALNRRMRPYALQVGLPLAGFVLFSATWSSFHISWRHFNAILPLLCTLILPGALFLVRTLRIPSRAAVAAALLVVLVPTTVELYQTASYDRGRFRSDSRTAAYWWILDHIGPDERILLDEYGPILQPTPEAVGRQKARLEGLPDKEAFTSHEAKRMELLERFPAADARNFDELAHPWWLDREITDEELRGSWTQRDMGNPLKLRVPRTVEEYRAEGFRWVVTNSKARARYFETQRSRDAFPSFVLFYEGLSRLRPVHTVDPGESGRGPVIWVYRLSGEEQISGAEELAPDQDSE